MRADARRGDPIGRAHLTGRTRPSPPIHRYPAGEVLTDLVERYWFPVWSLDRPQRQSTLQHPTCLIVVTPTYGRLYGVARGLSSVTLEGTGWAAGVLLRPAAGLLLLDRPVSAAVDTDLDLAEVATLDGRRLVADVRAAMAADPVSEAAHRAAIAVIERALAAHLPVDEEGLLINRVVAWLVEHPEVTRVAELAEEFGLGERSLQRLVKHRVGLSPKWLIQRRRLHDAVQELKTGAVSLADLASELGYTDQAHFTHDFRSVTGLTPGEFLADQGP